MDQSIADENQNDNFQEKIDKMWENLSEIIEKYYPYQINMIPSLRNLANKYKINRSSIKKYILTKLRKEGDHYSAIKIYSEIWNRDLINTEKKYSEFLKLIERQFEKYYHREIRKISSINSIQKEIGASKITIINWCKRYLNNKFGETQSNYIYEKIWGSNFALKNKYDYNTIQKFMINQNGYLLTTRGEWKEMKEVPSERYIKVGHFAKNINHRWIVKVRYLINQKRWCPECNDYFCQKILQMYMNKILGGDFRPLTLKKAFGLKNSKGGLLKYDTFCENVKFEGQIFKVAAEYDGEQHNLYPNNYHRSIEEFIIQKRRDSLKNEISNQNLTILIRIKSVKGFHRNTVNFFQEEIIKQFNSHPLVRRTKVKIKSIPKYVYNPVLNKLEIK